MKLTGILKAIVPNCIVLVLLLCAHRGFAQEVVTWKAGIYGGAPPLLSPLATNAVAVAATDTFSYVLRADGTLAGWMSTVADTGKVLGSNIVSIAAGRQHVFALHESGAVQSWQGELPAWVPDSATNMIAIRASLDRVLALRRDGTSLGWDTSSQTAEPYEIPADLTGMLELGCGETGGTALMRTSLVTWKHPPYGQPSESTRFLNIEVADMSVGPTFQLLLRPSGTVTSRGEYVRSPLFDTTGAVPPRNATNAVDVIAGPQCGFLLREDGSVVPWGYGAVTNVPASASNVVSVAAGQNHVLAIKSGGEPRLLGGPAYRVQASVGAPLPLFARVIGQSPMAYDWIIDGELYPTAVGPRPNIPAPDRASPVSCQFIAKNDHGSVTSSVAHIIITPVHHWGDRVHRLRDFNSSVKDAVALAGGGYHALALTIDGRVIGWGKDADGQATGGPITASIAGIAAGGDHSLAVFRDGTVTAWGRNGDGQTTVPPEATNVIQVAAGWAHSVALRANGTVVAWGNNDYGQTVVPVVATELKSVASGYYHTMGLRNDGTVITWGWDHPTPAEATNVIAVAAGWEHSIALRGDGSVVAWGNNAYGQCIVPADATNIIAIDAGYNHNLALRADGTLIAWGKRALGQTEVPAGVENVRVFAAGDHFNFAVRGDGQPEFGPQLTSIFAHAQGPVVIQAPVRSGAATSFQWFREGERIEGATNRVLVLPDVQVAAAGNYWLAASNEFGQAESEPITLRVAPVPERIAMIGGWGRDNHGQLWTPAALDPVAFSAGAFHNLALNSDGTVTAWGKNRPLNTGKFTSHIPSLPVGQTNVPPTATNVIAVAAGGDHSLALLADGSLLGWGRDWDGQTNAPPEATNIISIAAGWAHNLALRGDGRVLAWGNNDYGQTNVPMFSGRVVEIAAGYYHSLALLSDGSVVAWGECEHALDSITNVAAIAAGWGHSLAVKTDGTILAWGDDRYGQCQVPETATNVVAVAAGWWHSLALRADGTVVAWGANYYGVTNVPSGLRNVCAIAAGEEHSMVMVEQGPPRFKLQPRDSEAHTGTDLVLRADLAGSGPLFCQWFHHGEPIEGATNRFLLLPAIQPGAAGAYVLVASNAMGTVTSQTAAVIVNQAPLVQTKWQRLGVPPGGTFELVANVKGTPPFNLQWQRDGQPLSESGRLAGVNATRLRLSGAETNDAGVYALVVGNAHGTVTQAVAQVVVSAILAWGDNTYGQLDVPHDTHDVVRVWAGDRHNLALHSDGRLSAWGDNTYGQCDVPLEATNIISAAAGARHSIALRTDGTILAWGDNQFRQCLIPNHSAPVMQIASAGDRNMSVLVNGGIVNWGRMPFFFPAYERTNVIAVAQGLRSSYVLNADGTLVAEGGISGTLASNVVSIAVGVRHVLALEADGKLLEFTEPKFHDAVPQAATNVIAIAAGEDFSLALRADGHVVTWGANAIGLTLAPQKATNAVMLQAGKGHCLALVDVGQFSIIKQISPFSVPDSSPVLLRADAGLPGFSYQWFHNGMPLAGATNSFLLISTAQSSDSGAYERVGTDSIGREDRQVFELTVLVPPPSSEGVYKHFSALCGSTIEFSSDFMGGQPMTYQWRLNGFDLVDDDHFSGVTTSKLTIRNVGYEHAGDYRVEARNSSGFMEQPFAFLRVTPLIAWGNNDFGQTNVPENATNIISIASSAARNYALRSDGTVLSWGAVNGGFETPSSATNIVALSAGSLMTLALRSDGTVVQMGPAPADHLTPFLTNIVAVSAAQYQNLAVRADGSVLAWSIDGNDKTPQDLTNATSAVSTWNTSVALRTDGSVTAWGFIADDPQLSVPASATNLVGIEAGDTHFLALRADGSVLAWGIESENLQVPADATNIMALSADAHSNLALRTDGTLVTWGRQHQPLPPLEVTNLCAIATGSGHSLALVNDNTTAFSFPDIRSVEPGGQTLLVAPATGAFPTQYQWHRNGVPITGATNSHLLLRNIQLAEAGMYQVTASNTARTIKGPATYIELAKELAIESCVLDPSASALKLRVVGARRKGDLVLQVSEDLARWETLSVLGPAFVTPEFTAPLQHQVRTQFYRVIEVIP